MLNGNYDNEINARSNTNIREVDEEDDNDNDEDILPDLIGDDR